MEMKPMVLAAYLMSTGCPPKKMNAEKIYINTKSVIYMDRNFIMFDKVRF